MLICVFCFVYAYSYAFIDNIFLEDLHKCLQQLHINKYEQNKTNKINFIDQHERKENKYIK